MPHHTSITTTPAAATIDLEGVRVHNLKNISLSLPLGRLIVISGVSGSGKSSLAFDTLYAEGQRRYIETFSAYARQFLDRLEKPDADRIENIPPAIAIRQGTVNLSSKSTVATATEIHDYLRLLFARVGKIVCPTCGQEIVAESPDAVRRDVERLDDGTRYMVAFPVSPMHGDQSESPGATFERLREEGFGRVIIDGATIDLRSPSATAPIAPQPIWVIVDRLTAGESTQERLLDSVEAAFQRGDGRCILVAEGSGSRSELRLQETTKIDGRTWHIRMFDARLHCARCDLDFMPTEPRLFSFNTPLGACPECRGFGKVPAISFERLVPDPGKSLREGAIVAWTTPAYRHELDELLELAGDYDIPVDVPFRDLDPRHLELITNGVSERNFGGLRGFFDWLERHRYKLGVRVFLNRWRSYETCPACQGQRLQPQALVVRMLGRNIAEVCRLSVGDATVFFARLEATLSEDERALTKSVLSEIRTRLGYLNRIGLGYVTLDRTMKTLSSGEAQRVALTGTLGSSLVNTLYVLDEPSVGLHPRDSRRVIDAIRALCDVGNTVVVVEHEEAFVVAADELVDIGPGAGKNGGRVIYQGPPAGITGVEQSLTGAYLSRRNHKIPLPSREGLGEGGTAHARAIRNRERRHPAQPGSLILIGARQHNLKNLTVEFPLQTLCAVTGVSGSGKSTLIEETLYPALCRRLGQPCDVETPGEFDDLRGVDNIDGVILVDQSPIGRTPRSNAATYMKVFGEIRALFASTNEAKLRNFTATAFSFNAPGGGRCGKCLGSGTVEIDMQFLPDITMTCPECGGTRFRREIVEVKYRGLNIAEVLNLTVQEAFSFFRNHSRVLKKLKFLKDVGLDYLTLGQPANTLSGGESQRLKLASFLALGTRSRTLFLIDEPTAGLHAADVARLLECFDSLLAVGHSLIVVEHNLDVIAAANHVIDLGPEAGENGGRIVSAGAPEEIAACDASITGRYLRELL